MEEIFKDIPNYKGYYQVSNLGNVRSLDRKVKHPTGSWRKQKGQTMKQNVNYRGYFYVDLRKNGKRIKYNVHQLVAMAFLSHDPSKSNLVIDHINDNKKDNNLKNLQIISQRENVIKGKRKHSGTSNYVGVSWYKKLEKWVAHISINGEQKHLGYFLNEKEASNAYKKKLKSIKL